MTVGVCQFWIEVAFPILFASSQIIVGKRFPFPRWFLGSSLPPGTDHVIAGVDDVIAGADTVIVS